MVGVLSSVDARTKLVGENRLELLLFHLGGQQIFAINVFKVQEVMSLPTVTSLPDRHPHVRGVIHVREQTVPAVDLAAAIGLGPLPVADDKASIVLTEYNRSIQAFLVGGVDRIVNLTWEEILQPPSGAGRGHYLTAVTRVDNRIVEIIDVEKVLSEISPHQNNLKHDDYDMDLLALVADKTILIVDDSQVAINQMHQVLDPMGLKIEVARDGQQAFDLLMRWKDEGRDLANELLMIITDAEMPKMDGYMLTTEIRRDSELSKTFIVMHTSLSGNFNRHMVEKVGCDGFLSKFAPKAMVEEVQKFIRRKLGM